MDLMTDESFVEFFDVLWVLINYDFYYLLHIENTTFPVNGDLSTIYEIKNI
jgi:hypothetical protein